MTQTCFFSRMKMPENLNVLLASFTYKTGRWGQNVKTALLIVGLLVLSVQVLWAQSDSIGKSNVELLYSCKEGVVRLRWAPSTIEMWATGRYHGYIVEKRTFYEDGKRFESPRIEILTQGPILPADEQLWQQKVETNDHAAIIAQAFYGESFELNGGQSSVSIFDRLRDRNDRFVFSLLSADMNFEAAILAGWGFEDRTIKPDGLYEYSIWLNDPEVAEPVKNSVRVYAQNPTKLPVPFDVQVEFNDHSANVIWNKYIDKGKFTSYFVERSSDGKNFERLNDLPLYFVEPDNYQPTDLGSYFDSIPNFQTFYYRVRGIDCFGDFGPPSKVISGYAEPRLNAVPTVFNHKFTAYDKAELSWYFDPKQEELIDHFEVYRSFEALEGYELVQSQIAPSQRTCEVKLANFTHFIVRAVGKKEDMYTNSGPYMVMRPDLVPPHKPATPNGLIDTLGVLTLSWLPNTDEDLDGYFVYYKFDANGIWSQANKELQAECAFTDTVNMKLGPEKIYFSVRAVDQTFNHSPYSDSVEIKIPDKIKPVKPLLSGFWQSSDSVRIEWLNSTSRDVEWQLIYRKKRNEDTWKLIAKYQENQTDSFIDTQLEEGVTYDYTLLVIDDDGLECDPVAPVSFTIPTYKKPAKVEKFSGKFDQENLKVSLKWKNDKTLRGYQIYKVEDETGSYLLAFVEATTGAYVDIRVKPFKQYTYKIRAVAQNGFYSPFEEIRVEWK
jgi:uncharacterized protein